MKILILGAGGIGGYFGAQLMRAGADITFLLRSARKALLEREGLRVETPGGHFTVQPKIVTAETVKPGYDLIVLAPKAYDLDDALDSLTGASASGVLLPFLNGLDHFETLDQKFGKERVMGGVAHIAAMITAQGAVRQMSDMHRLTAGARHPSQQALADSFIGQCGQAAFDSVLSDDIEQVLWDKWVFLASLAGMTALCRASVGDIVATPYGEQTSVEMYQECCAVAERSGHAIGSKASQSALAALTAQGSGFTASMLRDLLAGQRTEHDHILGALVRRGQQLGCQTPLLRLAHTGLQAQAAKARGAQ